jgi:hypothetical protein
MIGLLGYAATLGGAYSKLKYFNHARLDTWRAYSGLTGREIDFLVSNDGHDLTEVSMYAVSPDGEWFMQVAWDIYIIVIDHTSGVVRVLAATDTD